MPEPSAYVRVIGVDALPPAESYAAGDVAVIRGTPDMYVHDGNGWNYAGMSGTRAMQLATITLAPGNIVRFSDADGLPRTGVIAVSPDNDDNIYPGGFVGWFARGTGPTSYLRGHSFTGGWRINDYRDPGGGYFRMWIERAWPDKPLTLRNASTWVRRMTIYILPPDPRLMIGG